MPSERFIRALRTDRIARSRARCDPSHDGALARFVQEAWHTTKLGGSFVPSWHIEEIGLHLEAVARRDLQELVVCQPPGTTKSMMVCVMLPAWIWTFRPSERILLASFSDDIGFAHNEKTIRILESDWYIERWGKRLGSKPGAGHLRNVEGGEVNTTSIPGGGITGLHYDIKIIDDPIKAADAQSMGSALGAKNRAVSEWRKGTFASRNTDHKRATTVLVMQRLSDDDLAGELIKKGYTEFRLPGRYESARPCVTPWGQDRRTTEGALLCPERVDERALKNQETDLGRHAPAQIQQNPSRPAGEKFRLEWVRYHGGIIPSNATNWIQVWDTNFKGAHGSDPVVGQVWCAVRNHLKRWFDYYHVHTVEGMFGFPEHIAEIKKLQRLFPKIRTLVLEEAANGPAIGQSLEDSKKEIGLKEIVLRKTLGGKVSRVAAASKFFEQGRVHLFSDGEHAGTLEHQIESMGLMARDDHADTASHGILYLNEKSTSFSDAMDRVAEEMSAGKPSASGGIRHAG